MTNAAALLWHWWPFRWSDLALLGALAFALAFMVETWKALGREQSE